ncbi:MAG: hypothetical protein R3D25_15140 [Geminicoccaceae bacterium]
MPAGVDIGQFRHVYIWDDARDVPLGVAQLDLLWAAAVRPDHRAGTAGDRPVRSAIEPSERILAEQMAR